MKVARESFKLDFTQFAVRDMGEILDFEKLKQEILDYHRRAIQAHWDKDVEFLVQDMSEGFFSVTGGEIRHLSKAKTRATLTAYLTHTTFKEYRDLVEPEVGFSDDGSIAWANMQVKVSGERREEDGARRPMDFVCAWLTLYRRVGDRWMRLGEASTWK
jgi:hypothetical protein